MVKVLPLLFVALSCFGQAFTMQDTAWLGNAIPKASAPISGGCTNVADLCTGTDSGAYATIGGDYMGIGTKFIVSSNYTACAIAAMVVRVGAVTTYNCRASIFTDSSGLPGTVIGTKSDQINLSVIPTSYTEITFTNLSASLTSGSTNWVVIEIDNPQWDGLLHWQTPASACPLNRARSDSTMSTWIDIGVPYGCWFTIFKQ